MWRSLAATAGTQPGAWRYLAALWCAGAQNYCISHAETTPVAVLIQGLKCTLFELLWLLWKSCSWHAPQGSPPRLCHRTAPTKPVSSSPNKQNTWKMRSADRKDKYFGLISELRVGLDALESILWPKWFYDPMNCSQFMGLISLTLCPCTHQKYLFSLMKFTAMDLLKYREVRLCIQSNTAEYALRSRFQPKKLISWVQSPLSPGSLLIHVHTQHEWEEMKSWLVSAFRWISRNCF